MRDRPGVTNHAIDRYVERVKPNLGRRQAKRELLALLLFAEEIPEPSWYLGAQAADLWLLIAPDAAAIVKGKNVVSVVTKELADEPARRKKREIERRRRVRRRAKTGRNNGRPRPKSRIEEEAWPV